MNANQAWIQNLTIQEVPWRRLATPYGRAADFPAHFKDMRSKQISAMEAAANQLALHMEHQGTLWPATPFAVIFLLRMLGESADKKSSGENARYRTDRLLEILTGVAEACRPARDIKHAPPLPHFSDMLGEKYLWPDEYDEDEDMLRYEEGPFPDDLFYSFYHYSHQALLHGKPFLDQLRQGNHREKARALTRLL